MKMEKCPHCGSEDGFYTIDHYKGRGQTRFRFDGKAAENGDMYDNLSHRQGKKAYCLDCDKYLAKLENMEIKS